LCVQGVLSEDAYDDYELIINGITKNGKCTHKKIGNMYFKELCGKSLYVRRSFNPCESEMFLLKGLVNKRNFTSKHNNHLFRKNAFLVELYGFLHVFQPFPEDHWL